MSGFRVSGFCVNALNEMFDIDNMERNLAKPEKDEVMFYHNVREKLRCANLLTYRYVHV